MKYEKCPHCNKTIVPYTLIDDIILDENFKIIVSDIKEGQFAIFREGKTKIALLGCPECKKTFIRDEPSYLG